MLGVLSISYLFLGGVGGGAFLVNAILSLLSPISAVSNGSHRLLYSGSAHKKLLGPGFVACSAVHILGMLCLLFHVGRPDRILVFVTNPTLSTVMVGAYALVALAICCIFLSLVWMGSIHMPALPIRVITVLGSVAAIVVVVYTGLLLQSFANIPFWTSPMVTVLFVVSSLSTGTVFIFIVAHVSRAHLMFGSIVRRLALIEVALIALELIALSLFLTFSLVDPQTMPFASVLLFGSLSWVFWLGLVVSGLVLPAILNILLRNETAGMGVLVPAYLVLLGGICLRLCVVLAVY